MQSKDARFVPTPEMWQRAEALADKHAPRPALNSTIAAVSGFFGGGVVAMVALSIAGLEVDLGRGKQAMAATAALCALICYLLARSAEKAHGKAFAAAMSEIESDWQAAQTEVPLLSGNFTDSTQTLT